MPAFAPFTVTDRATTPVSHVFVPTRIDPNGVAYWKVPQSVPVGERVASLSTKFTPGKIREKLVIKYPVVQTSIINGISEPKVIREHYIALDIAFDPTGSTQERADLIGMMHGTMFTSQAMFNKVFVDVESIY